MGALLAVSSAMLYAHVRNAPFEDLPNPLHGQGSSFVLRAEKKNLLTPSMQEEMHAGNAELPIAVKILAEEKRLLNIRHGKKNIIVDQNTRQEIERM